MIKIKAVSNALKKRLIYLYLYKRTDIYGNTRK